MLVSVKSISVAEFDNTKVLMLKADSKFKGIRRTDAGTYEVVDDCDTIAINLSAATAMLCACNDDIALYRSCQTASLSQRQLALILVGAKLEIDRVLVKAGDVIPTSLEGAEEVVAEYDMFSNTIVKVTLSAKAQSRLDDALVL